MNNILRRVNTERNLFDNNERENLNNTVNNMQRKNENINQNIPKKTYGPCKIEGPTAGIASEDIASNANILPGLKCQLCFNLVWDPVEIENCSHIFCKYCINKSLLKYKFCPVCRQLSIKLKSSITLKRCCSEFKIKCKNNGCKETPSYSNYMVHLEKCPFKKYMCLNEGCTFKGVREEVKNHCLNCKFRIIDCDYCHNPVKFCDFESHSKTVCTQEYTCQNCHLKMQRGKFFSNHYSKNGDNVECLKAQVKYYMEEYNKSEKNMLKTTEIYQKENNKLSCSYEDNVKKLKEIISKLRKERNILLEENKNFKEEIKIMEDAFDNLYSQIKNRKNHINNVNNKEDKKNKSINSINIELNNKANYDNYNIEKSERSNGDILKSLKKDFNFNPKNNNFYYKASNTQNNFYKKYQ